MGNQEDVVLAVTANVSGLEVDIEDVFVGDTKLTANTHYTIDDNEITLLATKLTDLAVGDHTVTIDTDYQSAKSTLRVIDTTDD